MQIPPPEIDSAQVLAYADVQDIPYRRSGSLYVDGTLVEKVPRLAICLNLGEDLGVLLFHCDEEWSCIGTSGAKTIEEAKALAERNYPGVLSRWKETGYTRDQAIAYYNEQSGGIRCSFCGRRPYEMKGAIAQGKEAVICYDCVERLHTELKEVVDRDG